MLEVHQVWRNAKGRKRTIIGIHGAYPWIVFFSGENEMSETTIQAATFEKWIARTGATVQGCSPQAEASVASSLRAAAAVLPSQAAGGQNDETPGEYVVSESTAAITTHLRRLVDSPIKYGGGLNIRSLCGSHLAWDTKIPVSMARCRVCRDLAGLGEYRANK
jgi:hypothetical protein